jgi:hypothetical protein
MNRGIPGASTIYREASDGKLKAPMRGSLAGHGSDSVSDQALLTLRNQILPATLATG